MLAIHNLCQLILERKALRYFLLIGFFSSLLVLPATAQFRSLGIGGMIGSPTGFSLKMWTSRKRAYDMGAAWSITKNPGIHLHADYLIHRSDLEGMQDGQSYAYYGIGGRLKAVEADPRAGVRFPLGVTYINSQEPFDAFFEMAPILDILPATKFSLNLSLGGRYYFSGNRRRF